MDAGTDVLDIGQAGRKRSILPRSIWALTGIEVTASHNPMNYNGMKLVRENAKPISGDTGLQDIQRGGGEPVPAGGAGAAQDPAPVSVLQGICGPPDGLRQPGEFYPSAEAGGELR